MMNMGKKYIVVIVICAILLLLIAIRNISHSPQVETMPYTLNNQKLRLLIADTPAERERGLMDLRELKNADGMIFLYDQKAYQSFWNKNTLMDLDVYWIDDQKVVGKGFLPSIETSKQYVTIDSPKPVNTVIEIPKR